MYPNIHPIYELVGYVKGLVLQIKLQISKTQGNNRISKKSPSQGIQDL